MDSKSESDSEADGENCDGVSLKETTHINVETKSKQQVTIDMLIKEAKRITVNESVMTVEDRDFIVGTPSATASTGQNKPLANISIKKDLSLTKNASDSSDSDE